MATLLQLYQDILDKHPRPASMKAVEYQRLLAKHLLTGLKNNHPEGMKKSQIETEDSYESELQIERTRMLVNFLQQVFPHRLSKFHHLHTPQLTTNEFLCMLCLIQASPVRQIAEQLGLSMQTVGFYLQRLSQKLQNSMG